MAKESHYFSEYTMAKESHSIFLSIPWPKNLTLFFWVYHGQIISLYFSEYTMAKESHSIFLSIPWPKNLTISHSCRSFLKIWWWLTVSRYSLRFFSCGAWTRIRVMLSPYGILRSPSMDTTHSVGLLWTNDQPVAETSTWQHTTQETSIDASGGIRIHNPSKRAVADPHLRTCGQFLALQIYLLECAGILSSRAV
jgi:hypothetical protein